MRVRVLSTTALLVGAAVFIGASPASAATVVVSGTEITVTSTGNEAINFSCVGGNVRVRNVATSPTLACSALTKVTVTSINSSEQIVVGTGLNASEFTAGPTLTANLGGGNDSVTETDRADTINLGAGEDTLILRMPTASNTSLDLGADEDALRITTINGDDTATATSTTNSLFVGIASTGGATSYTVLNADSLRIDTLDGDDTISTAGITAASTIDEVTLIGGDDDDHLISGVGEAQLQGGNGTNEFDGGAAADIIISASSTDDISVGGGLNQIQDTSSLRSGGRTLATGGSANWYLGAYPGDAVVRLRSGKLTTALTRSGQQNLNQSIDTIDLNLTNNTEPTSASLIAVDATDRAVGAKGGNGPREVADVYIPSGSWSITGISGGVVIDPANAAYGNIVIADVAAYNVHGPFADLNQGYAHRMIRDLLFRIPTVAERETLRGQLNGGTKTPTTAVLGLMDTDEYRGLDVDRVFVKYLRRTADPGGRTYWINSLKGGKALWRFRAQLFGSAEYFTKAGGTNAAYVTKAYNDVLGRNPDPSGQTYWTNKLNNGADRGSVALQFMNSPEARRRLVDDQFLRFLERYPDASEQSLWVNQLPTPTGELDLIRTLATSSSYRNATN